MSTSSQTTDQQGAPLTLRQAVIRLAQYGERTKTWSTATYDSGAEKALHQIALTLSAEVDRLRAERDALKARLDRVLDICDREERNAMRWENSIPMPEWVATVQRAALGDDVKAGEGR